MSARIDEVTQYSWFCADCNDGDGPSDQAAWIAQTADAHNDEFHSEATS